MTAYETRITQEQAQTIISAYNQRMAIEWNTKNMIWLTYRLYPNIITILIREVNSVRVPEKIVTYNVKSIELHRKFLLIETDGPVFLFPTGDASWPPVDKEKLLDGDDQ